MTPLAQAAADLVAAEKSCGEIEEYRRGLPTEATYNFGIRVSVSWGSGEGHDRVERAIQHRMQTEFREAVDKVVAEARNNLAYRRLKLREAAEFYVPKTDRA